MKRSTKWLIGGSAVVVLGVLAVVVGGTPAKTAKPAPHHVLHRVIAPKKSRTTRTKTTSATPTQPPAPMPALPSTGHHAGSTLSTYEAISHNAAPANPIQTAQDPADPQETWALVPEGVHEDGNSAETLWFGIQKTPNAKWTWIPSTLPGQLSPTLPAPARLALQWAFDLHENETGPANLAGNVSWQSLQGAVSEPEGWTMQSVSAADSATGTAAVQITVWQKSFTSFHGLYGMVSDWDSSNLSGTGALNMIQASTEPLNVVTDGKFL